MEAQGFGWEGHDLGAYVISEEDIRFVEALREVQPYVFLNRGRTFVVAIAGEIVDIPIYFDALLQVLSLCLSLSLLSKVRTNLS